MTAPGATGDTNNEHRFATNNAATPGEARQWARAWCSDHGIDELLAADIALVVSELVENARRHADGAHALRLRRHHRSVCVEVDDASTAVPVRRTSGPSEIGGRGLAIVDALGTWHSQLTPTGKTVSAVLA